MSDITRGNDKVDLGGRVCATIEVLSDIDGLWIDVIEDNSDSVKYQIWLRLFMVHLTMWSIKFNILTKLHTRENPIPKIVAAK